MLTFEDLGFPKDVSDEEIKRRLISAMINQQQIEAWIKVVKEELARRGQVSRYSL